MNKYRILKRFPEIVRVALKHIPFTVPTKNLSYSDELVCGTGRCPLAVGLLLSGYKPSGEEAEEFQLPDEGLISDAMKSLGLAQPGENVFREASDFIAAYAESNHMWKRALGV